LAHKLSSSDTNLVEGQPLGLGPLFTQQAHTKDWSI